MAAFMDANVHWTDDGNELFSRLHIAARLGYRNFILNNSVSDALKDKKKAKDKKVVHVTPASKLVVPEERLADLEQKYGHKIRIYRRFSTVVEDVAQTHKLQTDRDIQSYDIIAVQPTTEKTFQLACLSLDVDIISVDMTNRLPFYFKKTHINVALERGLHFEIIYGPALRDSYARRYTITNSLNLVQVSKGKNIIISGGCEKPIEFRAPYDIANLLLFGMTEAQGRDAISTNVRSLLLHAETRKTTGTAIKLTSLRDVPDEDTWKVHETVMCPEGLDEEDDSSNEENNSDEEGDVAVIEKDVSNDEDSGEPLAKKKKT